MLRSDAAIPVLYIVGADEFAVDAARPDLPKSGDVSSVQRIYTALRPDAGYLSPVASRWFGDAAPAGFTPVAAAPVTRRLMMAGLSVAVIFFPQLPQGKDEAEPSMLRSVIAAASAAADADLRIGVSPWGFRGEYAARQGLSLAFHFVLGAGEGAPFALDAAAMEPALWVRAAKEGRSVMVLDMNVCPARDQTPVWTPGINISGREIQLEDSIPDDPHMHKLLPTPKP